MRVGITGGICSGKSSICKIIKDNNYFVFNSDIQAKIVANTDIKIREQIVSLFGEGSYVDGIYNASYIRGIVFSDRNKLEQLNKCFGKVILDKYESQSLEYKISFFESALIFEHNLQDKFDVIIGVYCDEIETIKRLRQRNGFNDIEIENVLKNQLNSKDKMGKCDFIINTTNGIDKNKVNLILNSFEKTLEYGQKMFDYRLFGDSID